MLDTGRIIADFERAIGKEPRTIDWNRYGSIIDCTLPNWDWESDDQMRLLMQNWRTIFEHGFVTMAHLIQANSMLFQFGEENCPGIAVVWHDQRAVPDMMLMRHAARNIFSLKGNHHLCRDEWELRISDMLADEHEKVFGWAVPHRFRGDFDLRMSVLMFDRKHLPGGKLVRSWLPVVCLRQDPSLCAMIPRDFWPPMLAQHWSRPRGT